MQLECYRPMLPPQEVHPVSVRVIRQNLKRGCAPVTPSRTPTPTRQRIATDTNRPALRPRYSKSCRTQTAPEVPQIASSQADEIEQFGMHQQERTPSLISSTSRVTSAYSRSSVGMSIMSGPSDDAYHAVAIADPDDSLRSKQKRTNVRDTLSGDVLNQVDEVDRRGDKARGVAISQSLAALEGQPNKRGSAPSFKISESRRVRPPSAIGSDITQVPEEDEPISPSTETGSAIMPRRPMIRRVSTTGKVYLPKQSARRLGTATPTTSQPFPDFANSQAAAYPDRPGLFERRQSESAVTQSRPETSTLRPDTTGQLDPQSKMSSMVNLREMTSSFSERRDVYRKSQVLEVCSDGRSHVKYVSNISIIFPITGPVANPPATFRRHLIQLMECVCSNWATASAKANLALSIERSIRPPAKWSLSSVSISMACRRLRLMESCGKSSF